MLAYISKRTARSFVTLFIIITILFMLLRLMPIEGYFDNYDKLTPQQVKVALNNMGLNDPMQKQLLDFYRSLLRWDLGVSHKYRVNVANTQIIAEKAPISIQIGLMSLAIALLVGLPLGIMMARSTKSRFKIWDKIGTLFIVVIQGVPAAVYYLYIQGFGTSLLGVPLLFAEENPVTWVLPVASLALGNIAYYALWLRRFMVDEYNKDYIRLARLKGLTDGKTMFRHVFRNAFVPLVQYVPNSILFTVMGSIYVESLFSVPGMGGLLVNVIQRQDNTLVQALVLIYSAVSIAGLLLGDIMMMVVDPRISLAKKEGAR